MSERRPIYLLVNPEAGGKPGSGPDLSDDPDELEPPALADAPRERGVEVRIHVLEERDDAAELASAAARAGADIVIAGGDGTVGAVAAALCGGEATLGILARGSFNNVATGFGVPLELDAALAAIESGNMARLDSGIAVIGDREERFFEAAGVGLDADGFGAVAAGERAGLLSVVRRLWRALRRRRTPMRIGLDGTRYRTGAPAVTIGNGPYHGFGFALTPDADPQDGLLDVAIFRKLARAPEAANNSPPSATSPSFSMARSLNLTGYQPSPRSEMAEVSCRLQYEFRGWSGREVGPLGFALEILGRGPARFFSARDFVD
jgi:diacylglycerol kinase family enzyme